MAYCELVKTLFNDADVYDDETLIDTCIAAAKKGEVYNLRTGKFDTNVKTSIMSDITILDTVSRIIGIMATCNQFILPSAMHNIYEKN